MRLGHLDNEVFSKKAFTDEMASCENLSERN